MHSLGCGGGGGSCAAETTPGIFMFSPPDCFSVNIILHPCCTYCSVALPCGHTHAGAQRWYFLLFFSRANAAHLCSCSTLQFFIYLNKFIYFYFCGFKFWLDQQHNAHFFTLTQIHEFHYKRTKESIIT